MKCFTIVLAVCLAGAYAATLNDEQKARLKGFKEGCITETGVSADVVNSIIKGGEIKREKSLDCFSACMLKKIGIMRDDGSIDVETARTKSRTTNVDVAKADKVIDKCKDLVGKDTCETGGNVFACFIVSKDFPVLD
ncbi:general odorant-binding protein 56a-like [Phymastichus coffea]|uniref:general odorant-binding protein 56a-like n=1 Tax=Phymastichus coffea TaxID=108790 RepID=UPI00273AF029|nr:general odorant-binding protein 56a-like [Phymastichus coffea]